MSRFRVHLVLSLTLLCCASFGFADNLGYNYLGNGGQWSGTSGVDSVLVGTANFLQLSKNSSVPIYDLSGATLSFQTGGPLGEDGAFANSFRWAAGYSPITIHIPSALTEQGTLVLFGAGMLLLSAVLRFRLLKPGTR